MIKCTYVNVILRNEQPLYFENFDLENLVTPVKADEFESLLKETEYDPEKTEFIVNGFRNGFSLEYSGPRDVKITSNNLKLPAIWGLKQHCGIRS